MDKKEFRNRFIKSIFTEAMYQLKVLSEKIISEYVEQEEMSDAYTYKVIYGEHIHFSKAPLTGSRLTKFITMDEAHTKRIALADDMLDAIEREIIHINSYLTGLLNHAEEVSDMLYAIPDDFLGDYKFASRTMPTPIMRNYLRQIEKSDKKQKFESMLKQRALTNLLIQKLKI